MIANSASDPVGMVVKFKSKLKNDDGIKFRENIDAAICMFDTDCNFSKDKQISLAIKECKSKPFGCIHLIISNPCFEIWYLLHKRYSTRKYDESEQVISELKNYKCLENYSK